MQRGVRASDQRHTTMKTETPKVNALIEKILTERGEVWEGNAPESWVKLARDLERENAWLTHLVETIRDKADLRYGNEKGLMAFAKLRDIAAGSNEKLTHD